MKHCCPMRDMPYRCDAPNREMRPMRWDSAGFLKPKGQQNVVGKARRSGGSVVYNGDCTIQDRKERRRW